MRKCTYSAATAHRIGAELNEDKFYTYRGKGGLLRYSGYCKACMILDRKSRKAKKTTGRVEKVSVHQRVVKPKEYSALERNKVIERIEERAERRRETPLSF